MSNFGYQQLYNNGVNSNTQLRRAVDMIYQRGGTYEVVLTGDTYFSSMELDVDIYVEDKLESRMSVVPYSITTGTTTTYRFNVRPYNYLQNFVSTQHYNYYWLNDWYSSTKDINWNNSFPNNIKANFKYGYRYLLNNSPVTEYTVSPTNDLNHYTDIPSSINSTGFTASDFTNTGNYFDYVGGVFQLDEHLILPNFDQELSSTVSTGITINTVDIYRRYSPMSQFLMDYPTVPEQSETSRFLTDAPRIQYIQSNENYVLYYLNGQTGDRQLIEADFALFEFYDINNNLITQFHQELNFSGTTYQSPTGYTDTLKVFALPVGPTDINNLFASIDFTNVSYYRVQLFYGLPTNNNGRASAGPIGPVSEAFYFYLYTNCRPENTRVAWLNPRGGFDYFTFTTYRKDTKKIKSTTYNSRYYATNLTSPDRDIARTVKTFDTNVTRDITIQTDYISVAYSNWIEQLFYSPQVYIMKEDYISKIDRQDKIYKDLQPVTITSTDVETFRKKHAKLNNYRINLSVANNFFINKGF